MPHKQLHDGRLIWYASYGSNLSYANRFMCYITGGRPAGSSKTNSGCRDKTPPLRDKPLSLNFELYFAGYSRSWRGSPAFIRSGDNRSLTLGRMYLITDAQFNDVVLQENDMEVDGTRFVPPFERLTTESSLLLPGDRLYGQLLRVGVQDGWPVLTFTTTRRELRIGEPSEAYLSMIIHGLKEAYTAMKNSDIADYLGRAEGVRGKISLGQLNSWIESAVLQ